MKVFNIVECPFCGGRPQVSSCVDYSKIWCSCGISTDENRSHGSDIERIDALVKKWNIRNSNNNYLYEYVYKEWGDRQ